MAIENAVFIAIHPATYRSGGFLAHGVLKWAFDHPEVVAVEAESDPDNAASQRVLKKCGFRATGEIGEEGPRFIAYKGANRPVERRNSKP